MYVKSFFIVVIVCIDTDRMYVYMCGTTGWEHYDGVG